MPTIQEIFSLVLYSLWASNCNAEVPDPDLYWSFDRVCASECDSCFRTTIPDGTKDFLIGDPCDGGQVSEGIVGDAVSLYNQELRVRNEVPSCATMLDQTNSFTGSSYCSGITLTMWMKVHAVKAGNGYLFSTADVETEDSNFIGIGIFISDQNYITARVHTMGVKHKLEFRKPILMNTWMHVALVWKVQESLKIFVNGTLMPKYEVDYDFSDTGSMINKSGNVALGDKNAINATFDELKIWFEAGSHENISEIFREASIDPADFTTVPTTTTKATTTTPPLYVSVNIKPLINVSQEIYSNQIANQQANFADTEQLEDSSEKTIDVTDDLAEVLKEEKIVLEPDLAISYIRAVSETTNTIVAEKNANTWKEVSEVKRTETLNKIIENADDVTSTIVESISASSESITRIEVVKEESVSVMLVPTQTEEPLVISSSSNVEVAIPVSTVKSLSQNTPLVVATNIHTGAETCYDEISPTAVDIVDRDDEQSVVNTPALRDVPLQIITEIVSVNIKPKPVNKKITLVLRHIRNITNIRGLKVYCAYIHKETNRWTNHKCNITDTNMTHTTFESYHLTNFAILMQIIDFEIPEQDRKNLSLITYIGLSISIFCLVLSLCVFALVNNIRGHRTERYHLHANLALGMMLGQVTFLAGAGYPPGSASCKATAILLHFFYLTAFSWMLVEGLHLYNLVVKVFRSAQSKLGYYYMIGWGIPLLICTISVSAAFSGYGEVNNCWLDINNTRVIWAFVGPVLFVILVNIVILIKVSRVITTLAKSQDNCLKCMTDRDTLAVCLKAVAVLMPILGVTWVFGVLAINQQTIVFQYIFAIFNSLQGFFLFMFHCVFNSETRASLIYRTKSLRTDVASRSATNSGRRRQTKNPGFQADDGAAGSQLHNINQRRDSQTVPTTSRQASTNSNVSSNRSTGQNSAKIKTRKINPNISRAW